MTYHTIPLRDPRYPALLKGIENPPETLFVKGAVERLQDPQIAIVGSRTMSHYGQEVAFLFAEYLGRAGLTVTSGLARGIDAQAHQGALHGHAYTTAVLGTGIDQIYPAAHQKLAEAILMGGGCLVSPFPLGTPPTKSTFPQRNRIITGLSVGTLVVEASLKSGSLISARLAMEQGREVFAIPGSIHSPTSKGCHWLIQQGAKLVESVDDILTELKPLLAPYLPQAPQIPHQNSVRVAQCAQNLTDKPLPAGMQHLLTYLGDTPTPIDRLVDRTQLTLATLSEQLLQLEMQGLAIQTPAGYQKV